MSPPPHHALVVGATGLVGRALVSLLLQQSSYEQIHIFVRRSLGLKHPKLVEHEVDFENIPSIAPQLVGEVLFSALGTTLAAAGSKQAQYRVDHGYQLQVADASARNGVAAYVLVSSVGADPKSPFFYYRMKGELERDVSLLPFTSIRILRPGPLDGERKERRPGERLMLGVLRHLPKWSALSPARPIQVDVVARAALSSADDWTPGVTVLGPEQLFVLGAPGDR